MFPVSGWSQEEDEMFPEAEVSAVRSIKVHEKPSRGTKVFLVFTRQPQLLNTAPVELSTFKTQHFVPLQRE